MSGRFSLTRGHRARWLLAVSSAVLVSAVIGGVAFSRLTPPSAHLPITTPTARPTPSPPPPAPTLTSPATPTPAPTPPQPPPAPVPCGTAVVAPAHYDHVIWILMENKSFGSVIGSGAAPYENQIAQNCATDSRWSDAGRAYNSLPNYIALTSGITDSATLQPFTCDCPPSSSISVTSDNLFRQVRAAGGTERSYIEGMAGNCTSNSAGNAAKHNPALYYWGGSDRAACEVDDAPMGTTTSGAFATALSSDTLPTFSFITPNLCHDTHDCGVASGDAYLQQLLPAIFTSPTYKWGKTAVFVIWDEDSPIPNLVIAPSVAPGSFSSTAVSHYSVLRATEDMLGLPLLGGAATAVSLRAVFRV